ncbi:hypothetical protein [Streptomyces canus]|uniref:hypothetical protein n=1 Tax=Streptomyces canus TaxID=58343 RepID=UPI00324AE162
MRGLCTGGVIDRSAIARGLLTETGVRRVNGRVDEPLGPFDVRVVCPHGPDDGCSCRKPAPRPPTTEAACRAEAHGIRMPAPQSRPEETASAEHVALDLLTGPQPRGAPTAEAAYDTSGGQAPGRRRRCRAVPASAGVKWRP